MKSRLCGLFLVPALYLTGCPQSPGHDDYDCGILVLPRTAFALTPLNTPYDDWNMCASEGWFSTDTPQEVLFSSNRATSGGRFDLTPMYLHMSGRDSTFRIAGGPSISLDSLALLVNTDQDEIGPSFWFPSEDTDAGLTSMAQALVFARGDSSSHDIHALVSGPSTTPFDKASSLWNWARGRPREKLSDIVLPAPLNSAFDEAYATWNPKVERILFHSNRSGTYRIWEATVPTDSTGPFEWLRNPSDAGVQVRIIPELASVDGQERCPFLVGNTLFFVSDRPGGEGGLDVYRSNWDGTSWSPPQNLGPAINSASDEYRPFAMPQFSSQTDSVLIFSSNRPGGQGGFDLYMARL
jgi:hypothetical protein